MTEILRAIEATHAFDPVPLPGYRGANYVRFDRLTGLPCESRLADALANLQRTAIIGPVGSGKSSLIEYVVTESGTGAPLWVSAAHEGPETLRDPVEFARHMIRQIVRWSADVAAMTDEERRAALVESARAHSRLASQKTQTIGVKLAASWIEPSWSREIQQTLADPEVERVGAEIVASLDRLVELIHDFGRTPIVIVDDSDRWLNTDASQRRALLESFFRETCRMLAERNWAVVLAIHPEYCASPGFRSALADGWINHRLDIPSLETPDALAALFDERIARGVRDAAEWDALELGQRPPAGDAEWPQSRDLFEDGFATLLWERYVAAGGNLRPVLTVAEQAVREALLRGEASISCDTLRETILTLAL
jgi:hypothetical protein